MEKWSKLRVWHESRSLILDIYKITKNYPKEELYCLVSQMRRSAVSVMSNIVEGSKRTTNKDKRHFYVMPDTSLEELKGYLILSYDLEYITIEEGSKIMDKARNIGRMLNGLLKFYNN